MIQWVGVVVRHRCGRPPGRQERWIVLGSCFWWGDGPLPPAPMPRSLAGTPPDGEGVFKVMAISKALRYGGTSACYCHDACCESPLPVTRGGAGGEARRPN